MRPDFKADLHKLSFWGLEVGLCRSCLVLVVVCYQKSPWSPKNSGQQLLQQADQIEHFEGKVNYDW